MTANDAVLDRDGHACRVCGSVYNLHVHHVQYRSHLGGNEVDNLLTLCWSCHEKVHDGKLKLVLHDVDGKLELFTQRIR